MSRKQAVKQRPKSIHINDYMKFNRLNTSMKRQRLSDRTKEWGPTTRCLLDMYCECRRVGNESVTSFWLARPRWHPSNASERSRGAPSTSRPSEQTTVRYDDHMARMANIRKQKILNFYSTSNIVPKHIKQKLTDLKGKVGKSQSQWKILTHFFRCWQNRQ